VAVGARNAGGHMGVFSFRAFGLALVMVFLGRGTAGAADQTILGRTLVVKDPTGANERRVVIGVGKETATPNVLTGNPAVDGPSGGATLQVSVEGTTPSLQVFSLPQGIDGMGRPFWTASAAGYRYKDSKGMHGPVKLAQIARSTGGVFSVKVVLQGKLGALNVIPPNAGTEGCVALHLAPAGGGDRYSVRFGTDSAVKNSGSKVFQAKMPLSEGVCPVTTTTTTTLPTTTSSTTTTTTTTSTSTTATTTTTTSTTETTTTTTSTTETTTTTTSTTETTTTTTSTSTTATTTTTTSTTETTTTTTTTTTTETTTTSTTETTTTTTSTTETTTTSTTTTTTTNPGPFCGNGVREGNEACDGADATACLGACTVACDCAPPPAKIAAAGDSITQGYNANCTNIFCAGSGDLPQYSWFNGTHATMNSVHTRYLAINSSVAAQRQSVSGAEMRGGSNSFAVQAGRILLQVPVPDHVEVLLGGNDICNRGCVSAGNCGSPLYTDQEWRDAVRGGLDPLMSGLPLGSTVYLVSVPRVQDLREVGVAKSGTCDTIWSTAGVCRIVTNGGTLNGESYATRRAGVAARQQRYNEILREEAIAYAANDRGQNPRGLDVVTDYVDELTPSVGTTPFLTTDINGGDCFHPSIQGQNKLADGIWTLNPDRP
jgi:lysophospholipase L1-like esterase